MERHERQNQVGNHRVHSGLPRGDRLLLAASHESALPGVHEHRRAVTLRNCAGTFGERGDSERYGNRLRPALAKPRPTDGLHGVAAEVGSGHQVVSPELTFLPRGA